MRLSISCEYVDDVATSRTFFKYLRCGNVFQRQNELRVYCTVALLEATKFFKYLPKAHFPIH